MKTCIVDTADIYQKIRWVRRYLSAAAESRWKDGCENDGDGQDCAGRPGPLHISCMKRAQRERMSLGGAKRVAAQHKSDYTAMKRNPLICQRHIQ